jgi:hypothetical protein
MQIKSTFCQYIAQVHAHLYLVCFLLVNRKKRDLLYPSSIPVSLVLAVIVRALETTLTSSNFLFAGKAVKKPPARDPRRPGSIRFSGEALPELSLLTDKTGVIKNNYAINNYVLRCKPVLLLRTKSAVSNLCFKYLSYSLLLLINTF